jgi:glyoxylase-like metal-dependent hydrolase (beta-lactamase superfamily II)
VSSTERTRRAAVRFGQNRRVQVSRIADGLWRWTALRPEWPDEVGCVYCETRDGVVLVDPLVPADETERFWDALDRDVERVGGGVHVLVTVFWHVRSTAAVVERYGARVWAPTSGKGAIERRAGAVTDAYRPGDALPGGVQAFRTARAAEVVFWLPEHRALVPGDVLIADPEHALRLCPESWLPEKKTLADLRESLLPLLDLPVEHVLVSHGEPVLEGAGAALASALHEP